jgi:DNA-binding MarR family transcriptional regulator
MFLDTTNAERIHGIMQKFQKIRQNAKMTGELPRSEIMMLRLIKINSTGEQGVTISTLSELSEITKSAVSQVINVLEDKGYVERLTTKNDRRLVYVRLTDSGNQCLSRQLKLFLEGIEQIFAKMGEDDTRELLRLLEKLYSIMSESNDNPTS